MGNQCIALRTRSEERNVLTKQETTFTRSEKQEATSSAQVVAPNSTQTMSTVVSEGKLGAGSPAAPIVSGRSSNRK